LSIFETLVIFVGIPAVVIALVAGLVYGGSARRARRYRPGRPFDFTPVWFLAAPEQLHTEAPSLNGRTLHGADHGADLQALPAGDAVVASAAPAVPDVTGGASDRW
jgi:hypothetical protein